MSADQNQPPPSPQQLAASLLAVEALSERLRLLEEERRELQTRLSHDVRRFCQSLPSELAWKEHLYHTDGRRMLKVTRYHHGYDVVIVPVAHVPLPKDEKGGDR